MPDPYTLRHGWALTKALGDADVANERIDQPIAANRALVIDLTTKTGKPRQRFTAFLAATIAGILTPIPSVHFAHQLDGHCRQAVDAAKYVRSVCSGGNIIVVTEDDGVRGQVGAAARWSTPGTNRP